MMNQNWYVSRDGGTSGPFTPIELRDLAGSGGLGPDDFVLKVGTEDWVRASALKGLFEAVPASTPGVAPRAKARPAWHMWSAVSAGSVGLIAVLVAAALASRPRGEAPVIAVAAEKAAEPTQGPEAKKPREVEETPERKAALEPAGDLPTDDLNRMLRLLSAHLRTPTGAIRRPLGAAWIETVEGLKRSRDRAVAAAASGCDPAIAMRKAASTTIDDATRKNREMYRDNPADLAGIFEALDGQEIDVDEALRQGKITREQAENYRAARARADGAVADQFGVVMKGAILAGRANSDAFFTIRRAEVMETEVLAKSLVPALRARAGAKVADAPIEVRVGLDRKHDKANDGYGFIVSRSDRAITDLTVLVEIRTAVGWRHLAAFVPRLEPGSCVWITPFAFDYYCMNKETGPKGVAIRYSAWSDQFAIEGREIPGDSLKTARLDYLALEVKPGTRFVADPEPRSRQKTTDRHGLELTELTPRGEHYHVKGKLLLYDVNDMSRPVVVEPFEGVLRGPEAPIADGQYRHGYILADMHFNLKSPKGEITLNVAMNDDGTLDLSSRTPPFKYNDNLAMYDRFLEIDRNRTAMKKNMDKVTEGRMLTLRGKDEEATKVLNDFIATAPGEPWEKESREIIEHLDDYAKRGANMRFPDETKPRRGNAAATKSRSGEKRGRRELLGR